MSNPTNRQIRLLYVDPSGFMSLFKEGFKCRQDFKILAGVPADAHMLNVSYHPQTGGVVFLAMSSEYSEVPPGDQIPVVNVKIRTGS